MVACGHTFLYLTQKIIKYSGQRTKFVSFPDAPRLVIEGWAVRVSGLFLFHYLWPSFGVLSMVSGSCRWFFGTYAHGIGRVSHMSMRYSLMATLQRIDR